MTENVADSVWADGAGYEQFGGRWSRISGRDFIGWLDMPPGLRWLDVGCGTGAFSAVVLDCAAPASLAGIDTAEAHLAYARERIGDARVRFEVGDAQNLGFPDDSFDVAAAALLLHFVPARDRMIAEMKRVVRPGGAIGLYDWDFTGRGEVSQHFWQAAEEVAPRPDVARKRTARGECTRPDLMAALLARGGLEDVRTYAINLAVAFRDFDEYWSSATGFTGTVGQYVRALEADERARMIRRLKEILPFQPDGGIRYVARLWAVKGIVPSP